MGYGLESVRLGHSATASAGPIERATGSGPLPNPFEASAEAVTRRRRSAPRRIRGAAAKPRQSSAERRKAAGAHRQAVNADQAVRVRVEARAGRQADSQVRFFGRQAAREAGSDGRAA
jgi:hypothetical protein